MNKPDVTIIGPGNVGSALLNVLPEKGYPVHSVFSRTEIADPLRNHFPETTFYTGLPTDKEQCGRLLFITVSDDAITKVVEELAETMDCSGLYIVHCSGSHASEVLQAAREQGAVTASFHPMKAITPDTVDFSGIWFDVEGDEEVLKVLKQLARDLGADSFEIAPEAKPYLHASAVVASNYMVVLAELVSRISREAGMDEETALKALMPLMKTTLTNIEKLGPAEALTGPIARGDIQTVKEHLRNLENIPEVETLYRKLGAVAVDLREDQEGGEEANSKLRDLLK